MGRSRSKVAQQEGVIAKQVAIAKQGAIAKQWGIAKQGAKDGCEARGGKQGLFVRPIVRLLEATIVCSAKRQRQAKKLLVYPPLNDLTMWTKTHFGYYLFYN